MQNHKRIFFLPEEKFSELEVVLKDVREQVRLYKEAKKAGTLRKVMAAEKTRLFDV